MDTDGFDPNSIICKDLRKDDTIKQPYHHLYKIKQIELTEKTLKPSCSVYLTIEEPNTTFLQKGHRIGMRNTANPQNIRFSGPPTRI